jgi:hypothetical protein
MMERGYLDSREMANMFNLLRSRPDLVERGEQLRTRPKATGLRPPLLEHDGTRMARAAHSWYLRNTYVENNLISLARSSCMERNSIWALFGTMSMPSEPRRITLSPGKLPGVSRGLWAVTCVSCLPLAATLPGSSTRLAEKAHIGRLTHPRDSNRPKPGGRMRPCTMEAGGWTGLPGFRSGPAA